MIRCLTEDEMSIVAGGQQSVPPTGGLEPSASTDMALSTASDANEGVAHDYSAVSCAVGIATIGSSEGMAALVDGAATISACTTFVSGLDLTYQQDNFDPMSSMQDASSEGIVVYVTGGTNDPIYYQDNYAGPDNMAEQVC